MWDVLFTEVLSEVQEDDDSDDAALELPTPKVGHVVALVTLKASHVIALVTTREIT